MLGTSMHVTGLGDGAVLYGRYLPISITCAYLTPPDPYMTLTRAMHYGLVRDSSHQIWWP